MLKKHAQQRIMPDNDENGAKEKLEDAVGGPGVVDSVPNNRMPPFWPEDPDTWYGLDSTMDWQDLDLSARGRQLLRSGLWTDVEFQIGEDKVLVKAHRLMLSTASPVFAAMLYGPMAEQSSHISIPDVTVDAFKVMLEFIYSGDDAIIIEPASYERLSDIDYVAKKYLLPRLMRACAAGLIRSLSPKNVIQNYMFAANIEYQPLIDECAKIFSSMTTDVFDDKNFLGDTGASLETLEFIFSLDQLSISSEFDLLTVVEAYEKAHENMQAEGETEKPNVRPLLQKIRFLSETSSAMAKQHERLRKFLTEPELLSLMINVNSEDIVTPMPDGFSTNRTGRHITVPFLVAIPGQTQVGRVFRIQGVVGADDPDRFNINLRSMCCTADGWMDRDDNHVPGEADDIIFHMSVRFCEEDYVVVTNTFRGNWGREEREGDMPFTIGEPFDLTIEVQLDRFKVSVDGELFCWYNHRLPYERITHLSVKGDVSVNRIYFQ